jgi:hypothetical protein
MTQPTTKPCSDTEFISRLGIEDDVLHSTDLSTPTTLYAGTQTGVFPEQWWIELVPINTGGEYKDWRWLLIRSNQPYSSRDFVTG